MASKAILDRLWSGSTRRAGDWDWRHWTARIEHLTPPPLDGAKLRAGYRNRGRSPIRLSFGCRPFYEAGTWRSNIAGHTASKIARRSWQRNSSSSKLLSLN